ncbi:MAG: hypothetical protein K2Q10_01825, partial [Rhodospirillales bacterium]|nr:hypothetical protein [Rhodospirillales bacterium]
MTSLRRMIPLLVLLTAGCVTPNGGGYSSGSYGGGYGRGGGDYGNHGGYGKGARDRNAGDIHISWAGYGTHQRVCEATQLVRRDCEDRAHCEV